MLPQFLHSNLYQNLGSGLLVFTSPRASLSVSVIMGNGKRGGSHQKKPVSRENKPTIAQISIHLINRRKDLIEAYNRDPGHRVDLEVEA